MLRWNHCRRFALLIGLLVASAGCQMLPSLGTHRTNSYGVPVQGEPDLSELEEDLYE
jgi:hypothetical protein